MSLSGNSIYNQFRAAGRLINEWRDTLFYTALGAVAVAELGTTGTINWYNYHSPIFCRETIRAVSWLFSKEMAVAGLDGCSSRMSKSEYAMCASFVSNMATVVFANDGFVLGMASLCCLAAMGLAGGPKQIYRAYKDVMWDYPRKRNDGGTTQTQIAKNWIKGMLTKGKQIAGKVPDFIPKPPALPTPAFAPKACNCD